MFTRAARLGRSKALVFRFQIGQRQLNFLERLLFDLTGPFPGDVVPVADFLKRERIIRHDPVLDNEAFPFVELGQGAGDIALHQRALFMFD